MPAEEMRPSCLALHFVVLGGMSLSRNGGLSRSLVQLEVYLTAGASLAPVAAQQHFLALRMWRMFCLQH